MHEVLVAIASIMAVVVLPGLGLVRLLLPAMPFGSALAVAPIVSAGMLYFAGTLLDRVHVPVTAPLCLTLCCLAGSALLTRRGSSAGAGLTRPFVIAACAGSVCLVLVFCIAIGSWHAVPPFYDAFNHGLAVARIEQLHTLDPARVFPGDLAGRAHHVAYYPLALHLQTSVVGSISGLDVAQAWTITTLFPVCLFAPLAAGLVAGRVFPSVAHVKAAGALLIGAAPFSLAQAARYGEFALLVGLAFIPCALLLLLDDAEGLPIWILRSVGLVGLAGVHTAEVPVVILMAAAISWSRSSHGRRVAQILKRTVLPALGMCLLLAPLAAQLVAGYEERVRTEFGSGVSLPVALGQALLLRSPDPPATPAGVTISFWIAVGVLLSQRRNRALLLPWVLLATLFVWLYSTPSGLVLRLTSMWYSAPDRLASVAAACSLPMAALGLAVLWARMFSSWKRQSILGAGTAALGAVVTVSILVWGPASAARSIHRTYVDASVVGPSERAAFAYLARHQHAGEEVLNQWQDGSAWMYPLADVRPVFPSKTATCFGDCADRLFLVKNAESAGHDARVDSLLGRWRVRYLYVGARSFAGEIPDFNLAALGESDGWHLAFSQGDARVYERTNT